MALLNPELYFHLHSLQFQIGDIAIAMPLSGKPPDGGYGWVIVTASLLAQVLQYGIVWTVGVFYVIFLDTIADSEPAAALVSSLNIAACYGTGEWSCYNYSPTKGY